MMTRLGLLLLLSQVLLPQVVSAKPLSAFIESGQVGQALLLNRLGACYAITPEHVIDGGFFATVVAGLPDAPQGDADLLMTFGYDLALLRVSGGVEAKCNEGYHKVISLDATFSATSTGYLYSVRSDGSTGRQQVNIVDIGMLYVHVSPVAGGEPLMKGMSGSMLQIGDRVAGMLMSVDPANGHGKVLRYDRITETIAPFFGESGSAAAAAVTDKAPLPVAAIAGVSVLRWTSKPLDESSRAHNILDGDVTTAWQARVEKYPVDVEIQLSTGKSMILTEVALIAGESVPPQRLPRDFELMVTTRDKGGWVAIANGTLFAKDGGKTVQFAPVRGKRLLLRIHSNWGDPEAVGFAELGIR